MLTRRLRHYCFLVAVLSVVFAARVRVFACCGEPIISFEISVSPGGGDPPGYAGQTMTFDASATTDESDMQFYWEFGDSDSDTGVIVTHTYSSGGTYQVHLRVTDSDSTQCCPGVPGCYDKVVHGYRNLTIIGLEQFNADASKFPKCQYEAISRNDFVIVTNPTGHEGEVVVTDLSTSTSGTHTAHAALNGYPDPGMPADYEVIAAGELAPVSGLPLPDIDPPSVSASSIWAIRPIVHFWPTTHFTYERARVTWSGGKVWDDIASASSLPPGGSFSVTWAQAWGISTTVGVGIKAGVPGFETTFQASITGSWQSTTSINTTVTAPETPGFQYAVHYYQQKASFTETVEIESSSSTIGPWTPESSTDTVLTSPCGYSIFHTTVEKKCPEP